MQFLACLTCGSNLEGRFLRVVTKVTKAYNLHETGMARTFSMDTAASPSLLLARARRAASENGVTLVGDEGSGRFSHKMLKGEYRMLGRTVIVTITYKHRLVPWSVLEGRLRGLFGSGSRMPPVHEESTAGTARLAQGRRDGRRTPPRHRRHPHRRRRLGPPRR